MFFVTCFPNTAGYLIQHHTNHASLLIIFPSTSAQLNRRSSTMSNVPTTGRLGQYEIRGLLMCFLHIVKTLSDGKHTLVFCYHHKTPLELQLRLQPYFQISFNRIAIGSLLQHYYHSYFWLEGLATTKNFLCNQPSNQLMPQKPPRMTQQPARHPNSTKTMPQYPLRHHIQEPHNQTPHTIVTQSHYSHFRIVLYTIQIVSNSHIKHNLTNTLL